MKRVAVVGLGFLLGLSGCGRYVERSQYEDVQRQLAELRKQVLEMQGQLDNKGTRRLSTFQTGVRTWRFNSTTGESCILLTTQNDWKNNQTQAQSCDCKDFMADHVKQPPRSAEEKKADEQMRQLFCGHELLPTGPVEGPITQPLR